MEAFYRGLADDERPTDALRHAMAELRRSRSNPYFWAPFVVIGRPGTASRASRRCNGWRSAPPTPSPPTRRGAWDQSYSIIVEGNGVPDTTYQSAQPIVDQSYSIIVETENLPAAFGHGTMVAGIVRLVAPGASIMPLRVFHGNGQANLADVVDAVYYAVDNGATVINMSFSIGDPSSELLKAIKTAKKAKVMTISSAGNEGIGKMTYPAAYSETFGVASVDASNNLSSFSNYGSDTVHVAAPGEGIVTAYPGGLYAAAWGTSFSAAFVSGTVALLHAINPDSTIQLSGHRHIMDELKNGADDPPVEQSPADALGHGILNVFGSYGLGPVGY